MTIREVAKRAGVSLQTVSNVLNGRISQMGPQTRERVLSAIEELGYHPNVNARGLRSQRAFTIAYLTIDPSPHFMSDPFHGLLVSGMADVVRERDYCLLVQALNPSEPGEAFARLVGERRLDGAVAHLSGVPAERRRCAAQMEQSGCPFVLIEEGVEGPHAASVRADNRQGAEQAVEFLRDRGHKRIAFLTPERPWPAVEERFLGYQAVLKKHRLPGPREWRVDTESTEAARAYMEAALRKESSVSAVLCSNDVLALGALQAAKKIGRKVPEDMAIIGFDDFEFSQYVDPPLTTVRLPGYEMGRKGAELLLGYLQNGAFAEPAVLYPAVLVERGTA